VGGDRNSIANHTMRRKAMKRHEKAEALVRAAALACPEDMALNYFMLALIILLLEELKLAQGEKP
jgi:hypothetical protein